MKDNKQKQLFTELTSEEGAVIVGGATLRIDKIQAVKAGADTFSKDDTYITVNGEKIGGEFGFSTGQTHTIGLSQDFDGKATIRLFDSDPVWDDPMGSFDVSSQPTNGLQTATVSGSGSTYDVYYEVS